MLGASAAYTVPRQPGAIESAHCPFGMGKLRGVTVRRVFSRHAERVRPMQATPFDGHTLRSVHRALLQLAETHDQLHLAADSEFRHDRLDLCTNGSDRHTAVRRDELRRLSFREELSNIGFG
jgi:hypothetical protein